MDRSYDFSNVLICAKLSKFEFDQIRWGMSASQVLESYQKSNIDPTPILASHEVQQTALRMFKEAFPGCHWATREELITDGIGPQIRYVIALGGDNHSTFVSKMVKNQTFIGVNNDPQRSSGALDRFSYLDADLIAQSVATDTFRTEQWTRLGITLNGVLLQYFALSEVYIGEERAIKMTRLSISQNGMCDEQKDSGLIVATGAGSTGWFSAAARPLSHEEYARLQPFGVTDLKATFIVRERFKGEYDYGIITPDNPLSIKSSCDENGIIAIDADPWEKRFSFGFSNGMAAEVGVDPRFSLTVAYP